jgi:hypothetical protein
MRPVIFILVVVLAIGNSLQAQRIVYSEPDKDDNRRMNFEVVGKIQGNFLVYKNSKSKNWITLFNNEMKPVGKVEQDYLPSERLINVNFFPYNEFCYVIYEYQKRNTVYCEAVKIDGQGKKTSDFILLDTTHIGIANNNKVYNVISSEDKTKIMVFRINSKNKERYLITTNLFDDSLLLLKRTALTMPMDEHNDYLDEFNGCRFICDKKS